MKSSETEKYREIINLELILPEARQLKPGYLIKTGVKVVESDCTQWELLWKQLRWFTTETARKHNNVHTSHFLH